jgi:cysteine dioxygenase
MLSLQDLVQDIKDYLTKELTLCNYADRLKSYQGCDWQKYIKFSDCCYHREIVYQCDQFDLIVISWKQGQVSQIHDHPDQGCLMTILMGNLKEKIYGRVGSQSELSYLTVNNLNVGSMGYKQGNCCLHKVEAHVDSVSLHIYSPSRYQAQIYTYAQSS